MGNSYTSVLPNTCVWEHQDWNKTMKQRKKVRRGEWMWKELQRARKNKVLSSYLISSSRVSHSRQTVSKSCELFLKLAVFMRTSILIYNISVLECWLYRALIILRYELGNIILTVVDYKTNITVGFSEFYVVMNNFSDDSSVLKLLKYWYRL